MELTGDQELIASIRKGDSAEIRVMRGAYQGRRTIDVRVWFQPPKGGEMIRSKKGITFDEKALPDLVEALEDALKRSQEGNTK